MESAKQSDQTAVQTAVQTEPTEPTEPTEQNGIYKNTVDGVPQITFVSIRKSHQITVELDIPRHEVLISSMEIQHNSPVELVFLLKTMVEELKKVNIHHIIQQVTKDDWDTILRPQKIFALVNVNDRYDYLNVRCEIDRFPEAVIGCLGFDDPFKQNK
jgi:hypothetical protein